MTKLNGTPLKGYIGPVLCLSLDRPDDIKTVLMSANCLDKPYLYQFYPRPCGILNARCKTLTEPNLLTNIYDLNLKQSEFSLLYFFFEAGTFWKPIRKLMNPSFNSKILQSFVPIFNTKTNSMLKKLDTEVGNTNFDILPFMNACTLDMVCGKLTTLSFHVITL